MKNIFGQSFKFRYISKHALTLAEKIYSNQNILRYLSYLTDDPLSQETLNRKGELVVQPDITVLFEDSGISLEAYDKNIITEDRCYIFLTPAKGHLKAETNAGKITYIVDIITPYKFKILKGTNEYRDALIADEISRMIDGHRVTGFGDVEITDFATGKLQDGKYNYFTLYIEVGNLAIKDWLFNDD